MRSLQLALGCALALVATALIACGGTTITPVRSVEVPVTPVPIPTITTGTPFAVAVTASAAPTVALPAGGGYSGTMSVGGSIQAYAQVDETMQNTIPGGVAGLTAQHRTAAVGAQQVLIYFSATFDARTPAYASPVPVTASPPGAPTTPPNAPVGFTIAIPASAQIPGAVYYLAVFDPMRPSLGWQEAFEGPAQSGPVLSFSGNGLTFDRYATYWFALYVTSIEIHPTPAPSISPLVTPTPPPGVLVALQSQFSAANSCSGSPCAAGAPAPSATPQPPIGHAVATAQATPSLSDNSTQFTVFPDTNHGDVLWYTPALTASPLATTFTWDFWFTLGGPLVTPTGGITGPIEALEFDFNAGFPGYGYNFSSQCIFQGATSISPTHWEWQIWGLTDKGGLNWVDSGMDCQPAQFTPDPAHPWHHIVWNYAIYPDTQQKAYLGLSIDGGTPMVPSLNDVATGSPRTNGERQFVEVQYQMDSRPVPSASPGATPSPAPSFSEWVDNVTLTTR